MATKEAVFSLRVDTGNSVQDIQNADQAIKTLNKDIKISFINADAIKLAIYSLNSITNK